MIITIHPRGKNIRQYIFTPRSLFFPPDVTFLPGGGGKYMLVNIHLGGKNVHQDIYTSQISHFYPPKITFSKGEHIYSRGCKIILGYNYHCYQ